MSVSKWAYTPEKCDGSYCYGDCAFCPKAYEDEEGDDDMDETTTYDLIEAMQGLYDNFVSEAAKIVEQAVAQAKERAQAQAETASHKITNRELIKRCQGVGAQACIAGACTLKTVCEKWKQKHHYTIRSMGADFIDVMKPEWLDAEADE